MLDRLEQPHMNRVRGLISACLLLPTMPLMTADRIEPSCEESIIAVGGPCLLGNATSRGGELPALSREILGFRLGRHSFEDAQRFFGPAQRWHTGDAAASEDKVCYVTQDREERTTLVLSANSEMSGGTVDGMTVIAGATGFAERCLSMGSRRPVEVRTSSGIHLGMSQAQMKVVLGPPTEVRGDYAFYTYCSHKHLHQTDSAYEQCRVGDRAGSSRCSGLTARFEGHRLKWVEFAYGSDYLC